MNRIYSVTLAGAFIATAGVVFLQKSGSGKKVLSKRDTSSGSAYERKSRSSEIRSTKSARRIIKRSKPKGLSDYLLKNPSEIYSLTAEQAAELVAAFASGKGSLILSGLTSIDKDVARELAQSRAQLSFQNIFSIDRDAAQELAKYAGYGGKLMYISLATNIDLDSQILEILNSNPAIQLPSRIAENSAILEAKARAEVDRDSSG